MSDAPPEDWRITDQESYLADAALVRRKYRRNPANTDWDHDHCEFCWEKFSMEGSHEALREGYATPDDYRWICPACFEDFKGRFRWTVVDASDA